MSTFPVPATPAFCTVVVASPMVVCGKPAVATFTGSCGKEFGECAGHLMPGTVVPVAPIKIGSHVTVLYAGGKRTGMVTRVGRTLVSVRIPLVKGGSKVIERPIAEVEVKS